MSDPTQPTQDVMSLYVIRPVGGTSYGVGPLSADREGRVQLWQPQPGETAEDLLRKLSMTEGTFEIFELVSRGVYRKSVTVIHKTERVTP